jgi:hypothetical protein
MPDACSELAIAPLTQDELAALIYELLSAASNA